MLFLNCIIMLGMMILAQVKDANSCKCKGPDPRVFPYGVDETGNTLCYERYRRTFYFKPEYYLNPNRTEEVRLNTAIEVPSCTNLILRIIDYDVTRVPQCNGMTVNVGYHRNIPKDEATDERPAEITVSKPITSRTTKLFVKKGGGLYITLPTNCTYKGWIEFAAYTSGLGRIYEAPFYIMNVINDTDWLEYRKSIAPWGWIFFTDKETGDIRFGIHLPTRILKKMTAPQLREILNRYNEVYTALEDITGYKSPISWPAIAFDKIPVNRWRSDVVYFPYEDIEAMIDEDFFYTMKGKEALETMAAHIKPHSMSTDYVTVRLLCQLRLIDHFQTQLPKKDL